MSLNNIISASAGTGKTEALARRLMSLLRYGVKPNEIVALTFSRDAAGEIFERFVSRLAKAASYDSQKAKWLREVIQNQHLCSIGTLDSFLMRIVRSFPLELKLAKPPEIMSEYAQQLERARVSFGLFRQTKPEQLKLFKDAFLLAMNRQNVRNFTATYQQFVKDCHQHIHALSQETAWGFPERVWPNVNAIWDDEVPYLSTSREDLKEVAKKLESFPSWTTDERCKKAWNDFVEYVRNFKGSFSGIKGFAEKFLQDPGVLAKTIIEFKYYKSYSFGGEEARLLQRALKMMLGYALARNFEKARGMYPLLKSFEEAYERQVRKKGRIVFDDVPRLITELDEPTRMALEYRLDLKIRAWALDEFQDTSHEQWDALSSLISEAQMSDEAKSVFIVGDDKQAIYGWRNGDVEIFRKERAKTNIYKKRNLVKSYRFGTAITEAVNKVFTGSTLQNVCSTWICPEHISAYPNRQGFVGYMNVVKSGKSVAKTDFVEPVYSALKAVNPVENRISTAILVRSNSFGEMLATELTRKGLKNVVWEGESAILDTPTLQPFLDVLQLADHPQDDYAYRHFLTTPLCRLKYPKKVPSQSEISSEFSAAFASRGLVRTFHDLRSYLPEDPTKAWNDFSEARFVDFLRAASEFELTRLPEMKLSDFASYLESKRKRTIAEPGKIKIMTIHRSKGLGFDYVVLPLYEKTGLSIDDNADLLTDDWILPSPLSSVYKHVPVLAEAYNARNDENAQEALCDYYVAMTRAKWAMTLVLHPQSKTTETVRFSDCVRQTLSGSPIGNPKWVDEYRCAREKEEEEKKKKVAKKVAEEKLEPLPLYVRSQRRVLTRKRPSVSAEGKICAGDLFAEASAVRNAALDYGTKIHAQYEAIEYLDSAKEGNGLEQALLRRGDEIDLWREKSYELIVDGSWVSGCIDRAVFYKDGTVMISDYKTNRKEKNESVDDFKKRLIEIYAPQMSAYRTAVSLLTGIDKSKIKTQLLSTAIQDAIKVGVNQ